MWDSVWPINGEQVRLSVTYKRWTGETNGEQVRLSGTYKRWTGVTFEHFLRWRQSHVLRQTVTAAGRTCQQWLCSVYDSNWWQRPSTEAALRKSWKAWELVIKKWHKVYKDGVFLPSCLLQNIRITIGNLAVGLIRDILHRTTECFYNNHSNIYLIKRFCRWHLSQRYKSNMLPYTDPARC